MFGLGIRYLNGWAMAAADGAKKEHAEWPPHPDRVFMALAAAYFETDGGPEERGAFEWLERLEPPGIFAPQASYRDTATCYVPVNDPELAGKNKIQSVLADSMPSLKDLKDAGLTIMLEHRLRQPRTFPVVIPAVPEFGYIPEVHLVWREELPGVHRTALASLCRRVTSIGHPASLVQMWLTDVPPDANLVPCDGVTRYRLRVFGPGRLAYLKARCNREAVVQYRDLRGRLEGSNERLKQLKDQRKAVSRGLKGKEKKEAEAPFKAEIEHLKQNLATTERELAEQYKGEEPVSRRPEPGLWQGYDLSPAPSPIEGPGSVFDPRLVVLTLSGKRLSLPATLKLMEALRGAVMSGCTEQPPPEWLSGHTTHGAHTSRPHVALIPLPFVGREHADGRIMGVALALPRDLDPEEASHCLEPWLRDEHGLPRRIRLFAGQWLECTAELDIHEAPPMNLRSETWTTHSRTWASVTPVVLDRHFDGKDKWDKATETVKDACERIGLPRPWEVLMHPVSLFEGVPHARQFPYLTRKSDGGRMHHSHAVIVFEQEVKGPVLLGAGRFRGYGLCRPFNQGGER